MPDNIRKRCIGGIMIDAITYFKPTSTSGSDGYINYKMSGGDKIGFGGSEGGLLGWIFGILFILWVIGKIFG